MGPWVVGQWSRPASGPACAKSRPRPPPSVGRPTSPLRGAEWTSPSPSARPFSGRCGVRRSPDCATEQRAGGTPLRLGRGTHRLRGRGSAERCRRRFGCPAPRQLDCAAARPRGGGDLSGGRERQRAASPQWERWLGLAAAESSLGDGGAAATRPEAPRAGKPGSPGTRRSPGTAGRPPSPPGELPLRLCPPPTVGCSSSPQTSPLLPP